PSAIAPATSGIFLVICRSIMLRFFIIALLHVKWERDGYAAEIADASTVDFLYVVSSTRLRPLPRFPPVLDAASSLNWRHTNDCISARRFRRSFSGESSRSTCRFRARRTDARTARRYRAPAT